MNDQRDELDVNMDALSVDQHGQRRNETEEGYDRHQHHQHHPHHQYPIVSHPANNNDPHRDDEVATEEYVVCEHVDELIYRHRGPYLNFINHNCVDIPVVIGRTRLPAMDIRLVPAYLHRHEGKIKARGVHALQAHFVKQQCVLGAGEKLSNEDYGISFSIASLSDIGKEALISIGKKEAPITWCAHNQYIRALPVNLDADGQFDYAFELNCYIQLNAAKNRRKVYLAELKKQTAERQAEAEQAKKAAAIAALNSAIVPQTVPVLASQLPKISPNYKGKHPRVAGTVTAQVHAQQLQAYQFHKRALTESLAEAGITKEKIAKLDLIAADPEEDSDKDAGKKKKDKKPKTPDFPPPPKGKPLKWNKDGIPPIPEKDE